MSHPDPLFDPDNSYEDDDMNYADDVDASNYDDYDDFYGETLDYEDYNDDMDGDHDSAMDSVGWGDDDSLAYGGGGDGYEDW